MSLNLMFFCCAMPSVKPHLCRAEPKATVSFAGSTFHFSWCSGSA